MDMVKEHLERSFKMFIDRDQPFSFFQGLAEYLDYVLDTPALRAMAEDYLTERAALYAKLQDADNRALAEIETSKKDLLRLIKKLKLDPNSFERINSLGLAHFKNVIEEIEAYENGGLSKSGYRSDNLQHYLFEIAANILAAGHKDALKNYLVSSEDYQRYYSRVNGAGMYLVTGNEHGNFIFSKSWPDRFQIEAIIDKERKLKPWGAFEALFRFKKAYDEVCKNGSFATILQNVENTILAHADAVETAFMVEDLKILMGDGSDTYRSRYGESKQIHHLNKEVFKTHSQTAHGRLMRGLASESSVWKVGATRFDPTTSTLYFRGDEIRISQNRNSDPHYLLAILFQDPVKTWAFDEIWEDPYFHSENAVYDPQANWRKIYNAGYSVNEKVEKATKLKGFLTLGKTNMSVSRDCL